MKKLLLKRFFSLLICAALLMSTAGCAGKTNSGATEASAASEQNTRETETSGSPAAEPGTSGSEASETKPSESEVSGTGSPAPSVMTQQLVNPKTPQSPRHEKRDESGLKVVEKAQAGSEYENVSEMLEAQAEEYEKISRTLPDFYASTIGEILGNANGENIVYSPVNVYLALAMLAEISDGNSRAQILSLLGADSIEALRETAKSLWHSNYCDDGLTVTTLANSLWLQQDFPYQEETVQRLADEYYASVYRGMMGSSELNQALQDWLNDNTGHLLEDSAGGVETKPDTILALASAIYFKAAWEKQFYEEQTKKEALFYGTNGTYQCDYLVSNQDSAALFYGAHFTAYCRWMEDGNAMWFFLPEEGMSPEELSKNPEFLKFLQSDPYEDLMDQAKYYTLHVEIPKFDVNSDLDLVKTLQALGVTDVFSFEEADFSQIFTDNTPAAVSEVQHSGRVKIDEEGCEAAAFTVIMLEKAMYAQQDKAEFILDRPFLFAVKGSSGAPLFTGIVNEPGKKLLK